MSDTGDPPRLERPPADPAAILKLLARHEVRFLVAGGIAVQAHGYVRTTLDVDIIPRPDEQNMGRLAEALVDLEASAIDDRGRLLKLELSHPASLALGNYFLVTRHGALDLFNGPRPDLKRYQRLNDAAIEIDLGGFAVRVVGKDDLIRMKREAGREKDLADIAALTDMERLAQEERERGN